ncbi:hypothetical protein D3C78_1283400 [compost metagenome]
MVEVVLQDEDVDPALVVAGDQAGAAAVQPVEAFGVPLAVLHPVDPGLVAVGPALGDVAHQPAQQRLGGGERQQQLEQGQGEQRPAPQQGVEHQQQAGDEAAQRRGQVSEHGRGPDGRIGLARMIAQRPQRRRIAAVGGTWRTIAAPRRQPVPSVPPRVAFAPRAT